MDAQTKIFYGASRRFRAATGQSSETGISNNFSESPRGPLHIAQFTYKLTFSCSMATFSHSRLENLSNPFINLHSNTPSLNANQTASLNRLAVQRRCCGSSPFDTDPDPAFHFGTSPDPDPAFHFGTNPDPDPAFQFDPDLDPFCFKEVVYLKQYFLYIFT